MSGTMLFGIVAVTRIGISQFPDVDNPTISREHLLAGRVARGRRDGHHQPPRGRDVAGDGRHHDDLVGARRASARVTATFDLSRNIDLALQDTQAKIAQTQRSLPTSAQAPVVSKSNPDDQPILTVGVSGPFSRAAARRHRPVPGRGHARDRPGRRPDPDDGLPGPQHPHLGRRREARRHRRHGHRHHRPRITEAAHHGARR